MRQAWAALERILPRALMALTSIVVAAVTSPGAVGAYAWGVLVLTLFQSLTDQPVRHVAIQSIGHKRGEGFLTSYAWLSSVVGAVIIGATAVIVDRLLVVPSSIPLFASLIPLAAVPTAMACAVRATARMQLANRWGAISLWRAVSSGVGVAVGAPTAIATQSILGASLTVLVSEGVFALAVVLSARRVNLPEMIDAESPARGSFLHMQIYSMLGWSQSQLDRVFIGLFAATSALGGYSLASAVGRSAGDALGASQAAILRRDLSSMKSLDERDQVRSLLRKQFSMGSVLAFGGAIATIGATLFVLRPILGSEWSAALAMVPILSLSAIPSVISWSSAPIHIYSRRSGRSILAPVAGVLVAPLVALAALYSLPMAAWVILAREVVMALVQVSLMGRLAPWRRVAMIFILLAAVATAVQVFVVPLF